MNPFFRIQYQEGNLGAPLSRTPDAFDDVFSFGNTTNKTQESLATEGDWEKSFASPFPASRRRLAIVVLSIVLLGLWGKALYVQGMQGENYLALSEGNRIRLTPIAPKRGAIYDREGRLLTRNIPSNTLFLVKKNLPLDADEREGVIDRAAQLAQIPRADIDLLLQTATDTEALPVAQELLHEQALRFFLEQETLPGFELTLGTKRWYATSDTRSLSHVLGYTGKLSEEELTHVSREEYGHNEEIGKTGVEEAAETFLRGRRGEQLVEVTSRGIVSSTLSQNPAEDGKDITLALDASFQKFLEDTLGATMETSQSARASAVAMNPTTGELYALVSLPSFNNNDFSGGISPSTYSALVQDPNHPLFPRAVSGEFPAGSTFKPVVAATALAQGVIDEHTSVVSSGGIAVGPWFFPDWKAGGHGITDVRKALAESVNTFFYVAGGGYQGREGLGVERITAGARLFGFGAKTGLDIAGEADGFLPSPAWKEEAKQERWYIGDTYHLAIGQGDLLATPLQMAVATSVIASGGSLVTPHVIAKIGEESVAPEVHPLPESFRAVLPLVQSGMRQAVTGGSARRLAALPFSVSAKTGTAQTSGDNPTHAWVTTFAPSENPTMVLVILIEQGGEGSSVAVPVAEAALRFWFAQAYH